MYFGEVRNMIVFLCSTAVLCSLTYKPFPSNSLVPSSCTSIDLLSETSSEPFHEYKEYNNNTSS